MGCNNSASEVTEEMKQYALHILTKIVVIFLSKMIQNEKEIGYHRYMTASKLNRGSTDDNWSEFYEKYLPYFHNVYADVCKLENVRIFKSGKYLNIQMEYPTITKLSEKIDVEKTVEDTEQIEKHVGSLPIEQDEAECQIYSYSNEMFLEVQTLENKMVGQLEMDVMQESDRLPGEVQIEDNQVNFKTTGVDDEDLLKLKSLCFEATEKANNATLRKKEEIDKARCQSVENQYIRTSEKPTTDNSEEFLKKLEEQRAQQKEELRKAREERADNQKRFKEELHECREEGRKKFQILMECLQLKQRFQNQEQEWSEVIDKLRSPLRTFYRGVEFFDSLVRETRSFTKICEDECHVDSSVGVFERNIDKTIDDLEFFFEQLQKISDYNAEKLFLKVLQKSICQVAEKLQKCITVLNQKEFTKEWYLNLKNCCNAVNLHDIPSTKKLKSFCQETTDISYFDDLKFPDRISSHTNENSEVKIEEISEEFGNQPEEDKTTPIIEEGNHEDSGDVLLHDEDTSSETSSRAEIDYENSNEQRFSDSSPYSNREENETKIDNVNRESKVEKNTAQYYNQEDEKDHEQQDNHPETSVQSGNRMQNSANSSIEPFPSTVRKEKENHDQSDAKEDSELVQFISVMAEEPPEVGIDAREILSQRVIKYASYRPHFESSTKSSTKDPAKTQREKDREERSKRRENDTSSRPRYY